MDGVDNFILTTLLWASRRTVWTIGSLASTAGRAVWCSLPPGEGFASFLQVNGSEIRNAKENEGGEKKRGGKLLAKAASEVSNGRNILLRSAGLTFHHGGVLENRRSSISHLVSGSGYPIPPFQSAIILQASASVRKHLAYAVGVAPAARLTHLRKHVKHCSRVGPQDLLSRLPYGEYVGRCCGLLLCPQHFRRKA